MGHKSKINSRVQRFRMHFSMPIKSPRRHRERRAEARAQFRSSSRSFYLIVSASLLISTVLGEGEREFLFIHALSGLDVFAVCSGPGSRVHNFQIHHNDGPGGRRRNGSF